VRITHIPSGESVVVMKERSQHKNKAIALNIIIMKVINDKKRLLFTLKEKTSGLLVVAPEDLLLVSAS
jgi:protein subunit release factor A